MIIFVYGGSGSGKSLYAEKKIKELASGRAKYYLATMMVYDNEGLSKVNRHKEMRKDAGYTTIEQPVNIHKAGEKALNGGIALLEDMGNLVANEMFQDKLFTEKEPDEISSKELLELEKSVADRVTENIKLLTKAFDILVIVSNNIFEDGRDYDKTTKTYMRCLSNINAELAAISDEVTEIVAGIPLVIKSKG